VLFHECFEPWRLLFLASLRLLAVHQVVQDIGHPEAIPDIRVVLYVNESKGADMKGGSKTTAQKTEQSLTTCG